MLGGKLEEPRGVRDGLVQWREHVIRGVLLTSAVALTPALAIQAWQAFHGVAGVSSGLMLALGAVVALPALALAPLRFEVRAATMLGIGYMFTAAAMMAEGLAPAQFVSVCLLITLCVLLYSVRAALLMMLAVAATMSLTAYLFVKGYVTPAEHDHIDSTVPLNWLRVGLYTLFPSTAAALATNYLIDKLRVTIDARERLVAELRREVEQREQALAELERTQARLLQAQKLEALGQLSAGIAHDFNNTLSVMALEADLLRHKSHGNADTARAAESLLAATERGTHMTRQLLSLGRPETGERRVLDASAGAADCLRALQRLLPAEMTFEIELVREPLPVRIHAGELQQIVLNLGINARDAMPQGGSLRVTLERAELDAGRASSLHIAAGNYALLCFCDTGSGMDEATLARAFEPFFTTKSRSRGTGLGLTNVWNIAKRAGGAVDVESSPAAGTTFWVYLPLSEAPIELPAAGSIAPPSHALHGSETVLVVEDDIRIRALIVATLADAGYSVLDAAGVDAALGLERAHAAAIDLLCTDVVMPGRPVRELIGELQQRRPQLRVLVCSGYSEDEQIARGIARGELAHLSKPFTRKALLSEVRRLLDERELAPLRAYGIKLGAR